MMSLSSWLDSAEQSPEPILLEEVDTESPKKIYQEIEENARILNFACSRCTKVEDLFASDILEIRLKIKNLCEALISKYSPKCYGSCAREKLWRYVFYDAVQRARKLQRDKPWSPLQLAYIKSHLQTGIAQLHFFVMKVQECEDFISTPLLSYPSSLDGVLNEDMIVIQKSRNATQVDKNDQKKLMELLSMCFVNMGDLYRYLRDIYAKASELCEDEEDYFYRAQEWYTHAFLMNPSAGLALNQLGNVYSDKNWGIDSVYYLLYSSLTESAYEGALPNLRQLLDGKMVQFARRPALPEPKPLEIMCHGFANFLFQILFDEVPMNYEKFCQEILANFHERLVTYDPEMDEKLLFKIAAISVMVVWRLQAINSVHTSPAVAFAMSIFFTLVTQLGVILDEHSTIQKIVEPCHGKDEDEISSASSTNKEKDNKEPTLECNGKIEEKKKVRKHKGHCRGPRYRSSSIPSLRSLDSGSDAERANSEDDEEENSDYLWSESEYTDSESDEAEDDHIQDRRSISEEKGNGDVESISKVKAFSSSSSNGRSETSGSGENSQKSLDGLKNELFESMHRRNTYNSEIEEEGSSAGGDNNEQILLEVDDLLKCQSRIEPLLIALTPFIRWLQTDSAVKDALAANAEKVFLEKLCGILTLLASKNWAQSLSGVTDAVKGALSIDWEKMLLVSKQDEETLSQSMFKFQLPEDRSMLGLTTLSSFVQDLKIIDNLSSEDELMIRIGRFVSFGMWMNKTDSFSMMYKEEEHKFFVPSPEMLKLHMRSSKMKNLLKGKCATENLRRLTRAYHEMRDDDRDQRNRDRDGRRRRNRNYGSEDKGCRGRPRGGGGRKNGRPAQRRHVDDKPICIVLDLDATLKYIEPMRRLSCNKNFVVYIPHSVFESLDMMKDSQEEMAEEAKESYAWIDAAVKRSHPGIKILKTIEKKRLNTDYPADVNDIEVWEYYEMLECCHFLISTIFEGNPYNYLHSAFDDHRDKYSVFYLSGNDALLDTKRKRGFDPIKIARSLPGVFVDCVNEYPPTRRQASPALRVKGKTWNTSGKSKG